MNGACDFCKGTSAHLHVNACRFWQVAAHRGEGQHSRENELARYDLSVSDTACWMSRLLSMLLPAYLYSPDPQLTCGNGRAHTGEHRGLK